VGSDPVLSLINARLEGAETKPSFRSAWTQRRCLVPVSGFYEWKAMPGPLASKPLKQPFYISRKDGAPFTFAGLWERWTDNLLSFTILTTEAYDGMRDLRTRMPVILDANGMQAWLAGEPPTVAPDIETVVQLFPVSPRMNKPSYNAPDCVAPLMA
jgi:putative SOS response-associated peptidase YedK